MCSCEARVGEGHASIPETSGRAEALAGSPSRLLFKTEQLVGKRVIFLFGTEFPLWSRVVPLKE